MIFAVFDEHWVLDMIRAHVLKRGDRFKNAAGTGVRVLVVRQGGFGGEAALVYDAGHAL